MFVTLTGMEYLKAEIACKHDKAFEKETWADRLSHFETLDLNEAKTYRKASNPIGLRASVKAYQDTQKGETTGTLITLDACSSGLQILSLLVSCQKSYNLCGGDSNNCVDSYTTIYDAMNLHGSLTRKQVKAAIMTSLYGSVAMPELTFGNNVDLFYETMEKMAPGAWDLNLGLQDLWDKIPGANYDWVMPDNFHACIETKDKEMVDFTLFEETFAVPVKLDERPKFHKGLGPNMIHSVDGFVVREMFRRCMHNRDTITKVIHAIQAPEPMGLMDGDAEMVKVLWENYLDTNMLSVRIIDHINAENINMVDSLTIAKLLQTLPAKPFELVSVHDCFRAHPNYGNDLRRQYNNIMADINDSKMLESMCSQVAKAPIKITKTGTIPRAQILEANYMLA